MAPQNEGLFRRQGLTLNRLVIATIAGLLHLLLVVALFWVSSL